MCDFAYQLQTMAVDILKTRMTSKPHPDRAFQGPVRYRCREAYCSDSEDENERGEAEDDDHVAEHCESLCSRVSTEEERHHVREWHDSEREHGEDTLS